MRSEGDKRGSYKKKLLIPGWAGALTTEELVYIKGSLFSDRRFRAQWGFKRGTGRLSKEKIRIAAMDDAQEPPKGIEFGVRKPYPATTKKRKHQR